MRITTLIIIHISVLGWLLDKDERLPNHYVIERDKPENLEGVFYWVSYLAKVRGKYQTGKGDRVHSTSQLRNKKVNDQNP